MKICSRCKELKLDNAFAKDRSTTSGLQDRCRQCQSEIRKQPENRERAKLRMRRKREDPAVRQKQREYMRRIRAANPVKARNDVRQWQAANREKCRLASKRWRVNNPAQSNFYHQHRRARQRILPATLTIAEWRAILEYYDHACAYCGRSDVKLTQDHVIPVVQGGGYTKENIVPACRLCNGKKHARTPEQAGMKLRR